MFSECCLPPWQCKTKVAGRLLLPAFEWLPVGTLLALMLFFLMLWVLQRCTEDEWTLARQNTQHAADHLLHCCFALCRTSAHYAVPRLIKLNRLLHRMFKLSTSFMWNTEHWYTCKEILLLFYIDIYIQLLFFVFCIVLWAFFLDRIGFLLYYVSSTFRPLVVAIYRSALTWCHSSPLLSDTPLTLFTILSQVAVPTTSATRV